MDAEQLKLKLHEIKKSYEENRKDLFKEYAFSNNPHKVGDIIEDHCQIIKIERIKYTVPYIDEEISECVYSGQELTKKLKPFKNNKYSSVWQKNIKKKHDEEGVYFYNSDM